MHWQQLISSRRLGKQSAEREGHERRTEFQRDYDRLIFSSAFRRMQNKTQVFPLPGSIFVHNRLTHSLEVSSVGRSMGNDVAHGLRLRYGKDAPEAIESLSPIVSAACLAHDLGNPPFGHSGESAIRTFFSERSGHALRSYLTDQQWQDLVRFDGNANTLRLLAHKFHGRREGGFVMTYSTLASVVKYPFNSLHAVKPKFGFFRSEQETYVQIAEALGIPRISGTEGGALCYARHPLVYLVEAADDICYEIMDIEDAYKLRLLSYAETCDLLLGFFDEADRSRLKAKAESEDDRGDHIVYYRAAVIGLLERESVRLFLDHEAEILAGTFTGALTDLLPARVLAAYRRCAKLAKERIYKCKEVLDIDLAGYHIIYTLLELMIEAVLNPDKAYSRLLLGQASSQYGLTEGTEAERIFSVVDYLSGMTDVYALDLFRKIKGHSLPQI